MTDFQKLLTRTFAVSYGVISDHMFMCGTATPWEECPRLDEHRAEGERFADLAERERAEGGRS